MNTIKKTITVREHQLTVSHHATERLSLRMGNIDLADAITRGKTLNLQNVNQYPWLRKKLIRLLSDSNIKLIVNPYHNMQVVLDMITKTVVTIEYLDARGTGYEYNYAG
tara:strand:- start:675 stop:1001 length:327 start_codon:yes stop_codon:yes gene_type:complete